MVSFHAADIEYSLAEPDCNIEIPSNACAIGANAVIEHAEPFHARFISVMVLWHPTWYADERLRARSDVFAVFGSVRQAMDTCRIQDFLGFMNLAGCVIPLIKDLHNTRVILALQMNKGALWAPRGTIIEVPDQDKWVVCVLLEIPRGL